MPFHIAVVVDFARLRCAPAEARVQAAHRLVLLGVNRIIGSGEDWTKRLQEPMSIPKLLLYLHSFINIARETACGQTDPRPICRWN